MSAPDASLSPIKRALIELREMRARVEELERARTEPIAIVGIGCRFPGAESPEAFWQLLRDGVDAITEVPRTAGIERGLRRGRAQGTCAGAASSTTCEASTRAFFGISPREAAAMDPQQRLLLEVTLGGARATPAIAPDALAGSAHRRVRRASATTTTRSAASRADAAPALDAYVGTGNALSVAAGRLVLRARACRARAWRSTRRARRRWWRCTWPARACAAGECRMALAGGVNLILVAGDHDRAARRRGMLAPDGRCKTFDAAADGYVRGEGCGVVVLKRLSRRAGATATACSR